jgi:hypothetical protein
MTRCFHDVGKGSGCDSDNCWRLMRARVERHLAQSGRCLVSGTQAMNQRDIIQDCYPGCSQEGFRWGFKEIRILRAKNISFTNDRRLHDHGIVYIADRRDQ